MGKTRYPSGAQSKGTKLGYYRASLACDHCRKRKVRCLPSTGPDGSGDPSRCARCLRLGRRCLQVKVEMMHQLDKLNGTERDGTILGHDVDLDHDTASQLMDQNNLHSNSIISSPHNPTSSPTITNPSQTASPRSHLSGTANPAAASAPTANMVQSHLLPYRDTVTGQSSPAVGFSAPVANQLSYSPHASSFRRIAMRESRDGEQWIMTPGEWELQPQGQHVVMNGAMWAGSGSESRSGTSSTVSDLEYSYPGENFGPGLQMLPSSAPAPEWSSPVVGPGQAFMNFPPPGHYDNTVSPMHVQVPQPNQMSYMIPPNTPFPNQGMHHHMEPFIRRESADSEYQQEVDYYQSQVDVPYIPAPQPPWPATNYIDPGKTIGMTNEYGQYIGGTGGMGYPYQVDSFQHLKSADMYLQEAMQYNGGN